MPNFILIVEGPCSIFSLIFSPLPLHSHPINQTTEKGKKDRVKMDDEHLVAVTLIGAFLGIAFCFWGVYFFIYYSSTQQQSAAGNLGHVLLGVVVFGAITSLACGAALYKFCVRKNARVHDNNGQV